MYSLEMMLMNQALAAVMSGDLRECEQRSTEGLRIADQLDDRVAHCYLLGAAGVLRGGLGRARGGPRSSSGQRTAPAPKPGRGSTSASLRHWTKRPGQRRQRSGSASFDGDFASGQQLTRQMASRLALREADPRPDRCRQETPGTPGHSAGVERKWPSWSPKG